jgi:lipid-A-disaccharide synthase
MVVGETSGDLLAAGFMKAWIRLHPNTHFVGVGGPSMIALGFESLYPMEDLNVMGIIDPLKRLPRLIQIYRGLKQYFITTKPDCVMGVDYQEFNLTLESALKKQGIKTVHYVGPTLWAWRPNRIFKVKKAADKVLVLFPFEIKPYEQHSIDVTCVGHPFADEIPLQVDSFAARAKLGFNSEQPILAILPGSRNQEIKMLAEPFAQAAMLLKAEIPNLKIVCAAVNDLRAQHCSELFKVMDADIEVIVGQARTIVTASNGVLLASGTATLETMLLKKPMVIGYRVGKWTYKLAQKLVKISNIALPNILADKLIVPEFVQDNLTPENLKAALLPYFQHPENQVQLIDKFQQMHTMLRRDASATAANAVDEILASPK